MMLFLWLFFFSLPAVQEVPFKPDEEFSIRLDMKFANRPTTSSTQVNLAETQADYEKRLRSEPLPHLTLYLTVNEINQGESRMKIMRDGKVVANNRKFETGKEIKLDVGFTDDAKDRVSGYEHKIYFLSADKKEVNCILIVIESNGDYLVNGKKRGRF